MTKTTETGAGVRLAPEGASVKLETDYSLETTPLDQRRFSRSVTVQSDDFRQGVGWRVWLVEAEEIRDAPDGEGGTHAVSSFVPGKCMLYLDAGCRSLEEWVTTPEQVEAVAHALLAAVATAREEGLFQ